MAKRKRIKVQTTIYTLSRLALGCSQNITLLFLHHGCFIKQYWAEFWHV